MCRAVDTASGDFPVLIGARPGRARPPIHCPNFKGNWCDIRVLFLSQLSFAFRPDMRSCLRILASFFEVWVEGWSGEDR